MNTLHVPPTSPEIIKTPPTNPIVDGNPGDDLQLPADKPMGDMSGDADAPDEDSESDETGEGDNESGDDESKDKSETAQ